MFYLFIFCGPVSEINLDRRMDGRFCAETEERTKILIIRHFEILQSAPFTHSSHAPYGQTIYRTDRRKSDLNSGP